MKYLLFSLTALVVASLAFVPALADTATAPMNLGTFGETYSWAYGVSDDGYIAAGWAQNANGNQYAFLWTQSGGTVNLGTLGGTNSDAYNVSNNGFSVVGKAQITGNSGYHAFRWTQDAGMVDLGTLGGTSSDAYGVSADGSTVVGTAYITGNSAYHAYRWTQTTGMVDLGTLGGTYSKAYGASFNGSIVVGRAQITGDSTYHAFRWTQASGIQDLNTLLTDAGVNMTDISLYVATDTSANGKYIVGAGTFPGTGTSVLAYLVCYDTDNGCVGLTTGKAQAESAQRLSDNRRSMMVESRAAANELLGQTQPMEQRSSVRAGGMFGSAMGYVAGQASLGNLSVLGGLGYGHQTYDTIRQGDALTAAAALRYTFLEKARLHPYVELGGWATPEETLTMTRAYANGSGSNNGHGSADASAFASYGRGGLIWDATPSNRLVGYGEYGRQYLSVSSYVEASGAGYSNPFPASVDGGLLWMNVARAGFSWTHDLGALLKANGQPVPMSFTLAGAAAHSFDSRTGLRATLTGAGTVTTPSYEDTWGEFGARLAARFTKNVSFGLDFSGTAGADPVGTSFHGGASLAYAF